jgi:2'-hydroxyisoflavone reductase
VELLILGGTVFLGRHLTHVALERGHTVTHFNRGKSNVDLFPEVATIHGDRDGGLDALVADGRTWDAVIDTCGYVPRLVGDAARALRPCVKHYTFISSLSVYADFAAANDETSPLAALEDETVEAVTGETYGGLKAACERAADAEFEGGALHVRAGLIVGPDDPTDRFAYWPVRVARGGRVLAPGRREALVQFIDVRDLSGWILGAIDRRRTGPFNVTGPTSPLTMNAFLETCREVAKPDAELAWVDEAVLERHEVQPWSELPLWIPEVDMADSITRAIDVGLETRPLSETVRDTLAWNATRPAEKTFQNTLKADKEAMILSSSAST